jgi:hypothetical protein
MMMNTMVTTSPLAAILPQAAPRWDAILGSYSAEMATRDTLSCNDCNGNPTIHKSRKAELI